MTIEVDNREGNMPMLSSNVGSLVSENPARARVLEKLGLDYCCGGNVPLAQACAQHGLDPFTVTSMLEGADMVGIMHAATDIRAMSMAELCADIVQTHHEWLRAELPRLEMLLGKCMKHAPGWPWLEKFQAEFDRLQIELATHLDREEKVLFPAITRMELVNAAPGRDWSNVLGLLEMLEQEHSEAGSALARMRELSSGYTAPEGACNTMRAMLASMLELERDMHRHVHKENNVLFQKVREAAEN